MNQLNIVNNITKISEMISTYMNDNTIKLTYDTDLNINIQNTNSLIFEDNRFEHLLHNLPNNINKLEIKFEIKYLDLLPESITHLTINYIKDNGNVNDLPASLLYFRGNKLFNKSIDNLSNSVIYIELSDMYNKEINNLPINLKELIIPISYSKNIKIPESLELLILMPNYGHCINLGLYNNFIDKYTIDPIFSIIKKPNDLRVIIPVINDYRKNEFEKTIMKKQISKISHELKDKTRIICYNIFSKKISCDPKYNNICNLPYENIKNVNINYYTENDDYYIKYDYIDNEEYLTIDEF